MEYDISRRKVFEKVSHASCTESISIKLQSSKDIKSFTRLKSDLFYSTFISYNIIFKINIRCFVIAYILFNFVTSKSLEIRIRSKSVAVFGVIRAGSLITFSKLLIKNTCFKFERLSLRSPSKTIFGFLSIALSIFIFILSQKQCWRNWWSINST